MKIGSITYFWVSVFLLAVLASHLVLPSIAFAATNLTVGPQDIRFSKAEPLVGESIRIYAKIANRGNDDQRGIVKFFEGKNKQIGPDQPFSILQNNTADVFTDYTNLAYGEKNISVRVIPFGKAGELITSQTTLFVDRDSDQDGTPDRKDDDDDNDGVIDEKDAFPFDPKESADNDKDGIGDNKDSDDDNDGLLDQEEEAKGTDPKRFDSDGDERGDKDDIFPLDKNEWEDSDQDGIGNNSESDDDNDGVPDEEDAFPRDKSESRDFDQDRIGDNRDLDDDNDGLSDGREKDLGTNALDPDTDGDGTLDGQDDFPLDSSEDKDTDHDGLGDKLDPNNRNKGPLLKYRVETDLSPFLPYFFDAEQSSDPDGEIAKIAWKIDNRVIEETGFVDFFLMPGNHTLELTVTDNDGEYRKKTFILWVSPVIYILIILIGLTIWIVRKVLKRRTTKPFTRKEIEQKNLRNK